jgi:nuclear RNA export factor
LDQESIVRVAFDVEASTVNVASTSAPTHPVATSFPVPMQPSLFLDNVDGVTAQFLTQYFTFFDNKRSDLGVVYTPHATFSLSANTSIPPRARKAGFQHSARMPNQKALNWEFYHAQSRNLERISNSSRAPDKAVKLLHTGPQEISNALLQMPRTRHDMSNGQNFVVDAFPMVGMLNGGEYGDDALIINIHGEFAEGMDARWLTI